MTKRLTPPAVARMWGVKADKVIAFIRSGELAAINIARGGAARPRFLISEEAIAQFELRRTVIPRPKGERRPRRKDPNLIEFFK